MVAILLSTYNGEKYLSEQIDSLLKQTYTNWKLVVRDDGSNDQTKDILTLYSQQYPNKIIIDGSCPFNIGAGESFMHLLERTDADYYMFCDQDDVWMPYKIERTLKKAQEMEKSFGKDSPIGVFTDLVVVDQNLQTIMPSLWEGDNRHPEYIHDFYLQWTNRHASYGCTMLINNACKGIVFPYKQFEGVMGAHDNWIEYLLIKQGHLDYVNSPTIYYRQHGKNVIGVHIGTTYRAQLKDIIKRPLIFFQKLLKDYRRTKLFPFKISYSRVLIYRLKQTIQAIKN